MFFKKTRENMRNKMVEQNFRFLDDSLIAGEEVVSKIVANMPHGQLSRYLVAITNKRLIIINVDKASKPHVTGLKFKDILEVTSNYGSFKYVSVTFITNQRQIPTGVFESGECKKFLDSLENIRLQLN